MKYNNSDEVNQINDNFDNKFEWFVLARVSRNNLKVRYQRRITLIQENLAFI